jgi:prepilin-type N-terminal cleavage/methylation domain-containing protein
MSKYYAKTTLSLSLSRNRPLNPKKGFTLLEILLVIGIIAILAGIVIIAINPSKQLATVRNTERKSDIKQIESAITQYYIDNSRYPTSLTGNLTEICDTGSLSTTTGSSIDCTGLMDLTPLVPTYITAIPKDPSATTTDRAGYQIVLTNNKIGLSAPAELDQTITIGTVPTAVAGCGGPTVAECWSTQSPSGLAWGPYGITGVNEADNGSANTVTLAGLDGDYPAAEYCANLLDGGYGWFLPSYAELESGWAALSSGGFPSGIYWSSTEDSDLPDSYAWVLDTNYGNMYSYYKSDQYSVRCLR